jgi:hypothetical protein
VVPRDDDPAAPGARSGALAALAVGAAVFAIHAAAAPAAAPALAQPGQPAVLAPAVLARLLPVADAGGREQLVAALLVALAAALVTYAVAATRGDRAALLGGAVAGLWLPATPAAWALSTSLGVDVVGLAACAALVAAHDRLARGGGAAAAAVLGVAGACALLADGRAAMVATVAGALVVYRGRRGARWIALAPAYGAIVAGALIGAAAIAGGPAWPAAPVVRGVAPWVATLVDDLGPVALVSGVAGVALALRARGDRWLAFALVAGLVAALPPSRPLAPVALIALAVGVGWAVAAVVRAATAASPSPSLARAGGWAMAAVLAILVVLPPAWRSAGPPAYAAPPWKSSPATGR